MQVCLIEVIDKYDHQYIDQVFDSESAAKTYIDRLITTNIYKNIYLKYVEINEQHLLFEMFKNFYKVGTNWEKAVRACRTEIIK